MSTTRPSPLAGRLLQRAGAPPGGARRPEQRLARRADGAWAARPLVDAVIGRWLAAPRDGLSGRLPLLAPPPRRALAAVLPGGEGPVHAPTAGRLVETGHTAHEEPATPRVIAIASDAERWPAPPPSAPLPAPAAIEASPRPPAADIPARGGASASHDERTISPAVESPSDSAPVVPPPGESPPPRADLVESRPAAVRPMPPRFARRRLPVRVEPLAIVADSDPAAAPSRPAPPPRVASQPHASSGRAVPTLPVRVPSVQPADDAPVPRERQGAGERPLARRHSSQPHRVGQAVAPDRSAPQPGRDMEPRVGEIARPVAEPRSAEAPTAEQAPVRLPAVEAPADAAGRVQPPLDLGRVADDVYVLLSRRLAEERDRRSF